ncbi:hypothetical protein KKE60_05365 [Patescibacteria group bacterium]|nr:hypothetical protein [Patescibacteria group bacterium]
MAPQELRRRLHAVDPDLNIVPGGLRHTGKRATQEEWAKATGIICSNCGREVFRSRDGLCMPCWENEHEIEIRDSRGVLNFFPKTILEQITHKARNTD